MSDPRRPDDGELDEFLSGRDGLSRRYKDSVEREGPPPELDRAIQDRARQAIEQDQRARKFRFAVPLAMAATVVLSFGVFLSMRDKPGGLPPSDGEARLAREEKSVAPPAEVGAMRENDFARRADAREPSVRAAQEHEMAAQVQVAPAAAAPPPAVEALTAKKEEAAAGQLAGASAQPESSADAMAAAPLAKATPRPRSKLSSSRAWLERIRALKDKGEMEEARKQLDAYRDAHPTVEVPEDLRPLMRPVTPPTP